MLKIFGGMILGSIMTIMLLGGESASEHIFSNVQTLYFEQLNRPGTTTTLLLLVLISIGLTALSVLPSKPTFEPKKIIKRLRRHCDHK